MKFTGKYLCQGLFLNKVSDLQHAIYLKGDSDFLVNFAKFLRAAFYRTVSGTLKIYEQALFYS